MSFSLALGVVEGWEKGGRVSGILVIEMVGVREVKCEVERFW